MNYEEHQKIEAKAYRDGKRIAKRFAMAIAPIAHQGDGKCGAVISMLIEALRDAGLYRDGASQSPVRSKEKIKSSIRTAVFERDAYRCCQCGSHISLEVDHIHPESKGGTLDMDNLQTLCKTCNMKKGDRVFCVSAG